MANTSWIKNLKKPIAVIGLGKSGRAAFELLKAVGYDNADLITYDDKDSSAAVTHPVLLVQRNPGTLVVSPGVPLSLPWIQSLLQQGAELTSEISLAASVITTEKIIGVTGSVGKSTVVSVLAAALQHEDSHSFVGGNLGVPFCEYALALLKGKPAARWIVLELSSYQLENCRGLNLEFSAITFLSANHLERYKSLQDYYNAKLFITSLTKNICLFNRTSKDCEVFSGSARCAYLLVNTTTELSESESQRISLIGRHNQDNFAIAKKLALLADWSNQAIEKMYAFKGLPHRLENIGIFHGVQFINDSKATALDSVLVAVTGCLEKISYPAKLFVLVGGKDKNLPWGELSALKNETRIEFVFFGACGGTAKSGADLMGFVFKTLGEGIDHCLKSAKNGDSVLLSPGGTSLDEFKNFEQRGDFFKNQVISFVR